MKKLLQIIFSRMILIGLAIVIQAVFLIIVIWDFSNYFLYFYAFCALLSVIAVIWIINNKSNPAYKLAWIIPILVFPIFGGLFYLLFGKKKMGKRATQTMLDAHKKNILHLAPNQHILKEIEKSDKHIANQAQYLQHYSDYPIHENTLTEYFPVGEIMFERLKEKLKKAKQYIFLEYFIIEEGIMWNSILDILVQKVKEGVEVRLMYDDMGTLMTLPYQYSKKLEALGIQCKVFNPFVPFLSAAMNNRDHRKIMVIDGHTAFTGGINLADEYINARIKHGHWKDTGIGVYGEAAWNFTIMFLSQWERLCKIKEDYTRYKPKEMPYHNNEGYVLPYADNPLDDELIGETAYFNAINKAKHYVYIHTPYLILDNEMLTALCVAAKSGVDVRIVTPNIADKWYVHAVTRSYYTLLTENGVKIYEYTPGFIHSKMFVVDDELGIVGTINLDYRSLYLHYECAVWLYKTQSIEALKKDFFDTLQVCKRITLEDCNNIKWYTKVCYSILRVFAPLL